MAPVGAILSALYPRPVDPGRLTKQNQPHPLAAILGMLGNALALGPMAAMTAIALLFFHSPGLALVSILLWAGMALLIAFPLFKVAERIVARRRENLALVAQGR
jgi:hypothetical protein